jgi:hypothetical protein
MPDKKKEKKTKKPKQKQRQKQKQQQRVNVNVQTSSGGGGGGFIPMPSAPTFDYGLLANLIRQPSPAFIREPATIQQQFMAQPDIDVPAFNTQQQPETLADAIRANIGTQTMAESSGQTAAQALGFPGEIIPEKQPIGKVDENIPKARRRFNGESEEDYALRIQRYEMGLVTKSQKEKDARRVAKEAKERANIPVVEAIAFGEK